MRKSVETVRRTDLFVILKVIASEEGVELGSVVRGIAFAIRRHHEHNQGLRGEVLLSEKFMKKEFMNISKRGCPQFVSTR